MKRNSIVIAVLLVFGWFVWMRVPGVSGGDAGVGQPAPTWRARTLEGQEIGSKTLAGKVVIVDFWATWCPPCRKEIPGFIALQKQYAERGLVIVGASVDRGGSEVVKKFASEQGVNYPMIMAAPEMVGAFGEVIDLPVELKQLESESFVRVLNVRLADGSLATIPRANVEIIEE